MILLVVLITLIVGFLIVARRHTIYEKRELWEQHEIKNYAITLRHNGQFMDAFASEELGLGTTLTVIDNKLARVSDLAGQALSPEDYEQFTVAGLFEVAMWQPMLRFDPIYGFPARMGFHGWAVEVINFQPNVTNGSWPRRYEERQ